MMSAVEIVTDAPAGRLGAVVRLQVPVHRAWHLWADPVRLGRWWGPPGYPATVTRHELVAGGTVQYHMTSPDGERHHGLWQVLEVREHALLRVRDLFADADGAPDPSMPAGEMVVEFSPSPPSATLMAMTVTYPTREALEQVLAMGMVEGLTAAAGQIPEALQG